LPAHAGNPKGALNYLKSMHCLGAKGLCGDRTEFAGARYSDYLDDEAGDPAVVADGPKLPPAPGDEGQVRAGKFFHIDQNILASP
jgi:hypothetical protein